MLLCPSLLLLLLLCCNLLLLVDLSYVLWGPSRHLRSLTAANWVSFDFNVSYSSWWGYSLINTLKLKKKINFSLGSIQDKLGTQSTMPLAHANTELMILFAEAPHSGFAVQSPDESLINVQKDSPAALLRGVSIISGYGVATISRPPEITGLFCKRAIQKRRYSAKETYHFKEPTNRSHPTMKDFLERCELPRKMWNGNNSHLSSKFFLVKSRTRAQILLRTLRSLHLATSSHLWLYFPSPCFTARKQ